MPEDFCQPRPTLCCLLFLCVLAQSCGDVGGGTAQRDTSGVK